MKNSHLIVQTVLIAALAAVGADAAVITWSSTPYINQGGAVKNQMGQNQFDQSGTLLLAVNAGGVDQTLTQSSDPNIAFTATDPNLDLSDFTGAIGNTFHAALGGNNNISSSAVFTTGATLDGSETVGLSGLVVGKSYRIQAFLMDGRGAQNGRYAEFDGLNQGVFANGVTNVTWGDGLLVTGTFLADATTQSFEIETFNPNNTSAGGQLNAILVHRQVPAPAALPAGLGVLALLSIRRRR